MRQLIREILTASRFASVGVIATIVHVLVAFFVLNFLGAGLSMANAAGFAVAFTVSYVGHYYFTFKSSKRHGGTAVRFLTSSLIAYLANITVVTVLGSVTPLGPEVRLALGIATMPVFTFVLSRLWVY